MSRTGGSSVLFFLMPLLVVLYACGGGTTPVVTVVATATSTALPTGTEVARLATFTPTATDTTTSTPPATTVLSPTGATCVSDSQYIADVTIPDGSALAPGVSFVKTWRVKNSGSCAWDNNYAIVYVSGTAFAGGARPIPNAEPGAVVDVSVPMKAPSTPGSYSGLWQLRASNGVLFGTSLSTVLVVPVPTLALPDVTQIEGDHADAQILSPGYARQGKNYPPAKTSLIFQVKARDTRAGNNDGDGVNNVEFHVFDDNDNEVYSHKETTPAYCAFGGNGPCAEFVFAEHGDQWSSNGPAIVNGTYRLEVHVNTKRGDRWDASLDFQIQL